MKITIHQPEHFPYLGFFQKMKATDLFVIIDDVQYTRGNFQNRNKFVNKNNIEEWFGVQLESSASKMNINQIKTASGNWRTKVIKKIKQNFGYDFTDIYENELLVDINLKSIEWARKKLNINTPMIKSSDLNINSSSTQRLVDICKKVKATEYISGQGGKNYLDLKLFDNINVTYHTPQLDNYYSCIYNIK